LGLGTTHEGLAFPNLPTIPIFTRIWDFPKVVLAPWNVNVAYGESIYQRRCYCFSLASSRNRIEQKRIHIFAIKGLLEPIMRMANANIFTRHREVGRTSRFREPIIACKILARA
jgi:hypothetical protein